MSNTRMAFAPASFPRHKHHTFSVRSVEEAYRILNAIEKPTGRDIFQRFFIRIRLGVMNFFLGFMKYLLFPVQKDIGREFYDIVVYTVGILGDNVVMLPSLAALKRRYPSATLTVITNCQAWDSQGASAILGPSPFTDRLIVLGDHPVVRRGFRMIATAISCRDVACDLFVNLSPFGNRGWFGAVVREMLFAKKLGAKRAIGFRVTAPKLSRVFNKARLHFVQNEPRRPRTVLSELGLKPSENEDLFPRDPIAKNSVLRKIEHLGGKPKSMVVIHPGGKFIAQRWAPKHFGILAEWISRNKNTSVIITGLESERAIAEHVVSHSHGGAINMAGKTDVQELIELLRLADCCITNDTGTLHLAAMVAVPTVAIFSMRDGLINWLPSGNTTVSLFHPEDCRFCYDDQCENNDCLKNISVDDVIWTVENLKDLLRM